SGTSQKISQIRSSKNIPNAQLSTEDVLLTSFPTQGLLFFHHPARLYSVFVLYFHYINTVCPVCRRNCCLKFAVFFAENLLSGNIKNADGCRQFIGKCNGQ